MGEIMGALHRESVAPKGRVEIFQTRGVPKIIKGELLERKIPKILEGRIPAVHKSAEIDFSGCEILSSLDVKNIIVGVGKDKLIQSLTTGFIYQIARMAIGDRGTIPSDSTQPKVPTSSMTALYNEIFRSDIDTYIEDVGVTPGVHEVKFIKTFSAVNVPITAFSNQANPIVNEIGLIMIDPFGVPLPRTDISPPTIPEADETLFSIRTFKSVPFEAANDISITIRYTIYIED